MQVRFGTVPVGFDARLCARPECGRTATSSLTYHYASGAVWVDPLPPERDPAGYDLCELHAARVRVPHGWCLLDRRERSAP